MVVRTLGAGTLTRLMAADERDGPDLSWLLFGPIDPGWWSPPATPSCRWRRNRPPAPTGVRQAS